MKIELPFKIVGHQLQYTKSNGCRPATQEERRLYEIVQALAPSVSAAIAEPVEVAQVVSSEPEVWVCSRCSGGLIPVPGTDRRSFMHGCTQKVQR